MEEKHNNLYNGIEDIQIVGVVITDRKETTYKASYTVEVEELHILQNNKNHSSRKFKGTNLIIYTSKDNNLEYGDKVILNGTFERAKSATNYKAFDYREYLKIKNIYGIVNVEGEVKLLEKNKLNPVLISINNIRNKIKSNLKEILGEEANVAIGILLRRY